ncbi:MAG: DHHA1 domain-containing protein [Candidatus Aenigmatarchaeota archaeon]
MDAENIIITHNDLDGLISSAIAIKFLENSKIYFTSNLSFKSCFFKVVSRISNYNKICFFDLSMRNEILKTSCALFNKVLWIDHHINEKFLSFQNLEAIIDHNSKSTTELVSKYFNFYSDWVEITNEVDSNSCTSKESRDIRDYLSFLRIKYRKLYNRYLGMLAKKILNFNPKDFVNTEEVKNSIFQFENLKKEFEKIIQEKLEIVEIKNLRVGILETKTNIPPYIVVENEMLKNNSDFLIIIYRGLRGVKIEFRSFKDVDVQKIAKIFNGGGHQKASGAYIQQNLTKSQILSKIEEVL